MKSKDLQQVVFRKYEDGDGPTKIFRDLNGSLGLATIKRWCKMIRDTGSIQLSKPPGGPRFARTNEKIFDLDGMYDSQNQRIWAASRDEADEKGSIKCVNWKKVTSKATLIDELKCAVKKIRQDVVLQSCSSWTARLNRVLKNGGGYLKK
ncbi:unnamed protein product [Rotaria magnacalcarata]|uniref:Uncharacterized protein n=1 Tax=Rotaria magnacalcarata TaxID=392030 RepID=A0A819V9X8_9BILA|nr:unnamed protein product [Rotaria magnacalcarata]CAF4283284.1 unnamed protein product [Rotaria magnacalcarata]CAF4893400.1 unnamed protein product [Rotaria magnacalcarata]